MRASRSEAIHDVADHPHIVLILAEEKLSGILDTSGGILSSVGTHTTFALAPLSRGHFDIGLNGINSTNDSNGLISPAVLVYERGHPIAALKIQ